MLNFLTVIKYFALCIYKFILFQDSLQQFGCKEIENTFSNPIEKEIENTSVIQLRIRNHTFMDIYDSSVPHVALLITVVFEWKLLNFDDHDFVSQLAHFIS